MKLSRYGTEKWWLLQEHSKADQVYLDLQFLSREYNSFLATKIKLKVQLSNLIERTFPGLEKILKGHYWALLLDFYELYPCATLVREMSEKKFSTKFIKLATKKDTVKVPRSHRVSINWLTSASRLNRIIRLQPSRLNTVSPSFVRRKRQL